LLSAPETKATRNLGQIGKALGNLSRAQREALESSEAAGAGLDRLNDALASDAADATGKVAAAHVRLERDTERATAAFARQEASLAESRQSYAALEAQMESARAVIRRLVDAGQAEGADKVALAAKLKVAESAYRSLETEARRTSKTIAGQEASLNTSRLALQQLSSATNAAEVVMARVRAGPATGGKKGGLLGLQPHELTNLSYQVNDIATQLASGTSVFQTFAQQGGQILQIFPRFALGIAGAIPIIGSIGAALAPVIASLKNLADQSASTRQFSSALAATADSARYNGGALADTAAELDRYGQSLKDARGSVRAFMAEGVDPAQLERFGRAAEAMAKVLGGSIPDAAKRAAVAFTGGYDAVKELDSSLNFLTAAEREQIRTLFESGRAAEARTKAFDIFAARMQDAAAKSRGPWSAAAQSLGNAWNSFVGFLSNTAPVRGMIGLLSQLARAAENAAARLPGAKGIVAGGNPAIAVSRPTWPS
jgi:phage-related minor tail protein